MEQCNFKELNDGEQFIFVEGHTDKSGSHIYRKISKDNEIYAFTLVNRCEREICRDIKPDEKVVRVRFFPLS